jgi:hypothetical protein
LNLLRYLESSQKVLALGRLLAHSAVVVVVNLPPPFVSPGTMPTVGPASMIDENWRGITLPQKQEGVPMARNKFGKQFEQISDKAQAATVELKAAAKNGKDQLKADVANARVQATAAAANVKDKAADTHEKAVSQWDGTRNKLQHHVDNARAKVADKKAQHDAKDAVAPTSPNPMP